MAELQAALYRIEGRYQDARDVIKQERLVDSDAFEMSHDLTILRAFERQI